MLFDMAHETIIIIAWEVFVAFSNGTPYSIRPISDGGLISYSITAKRKEVKTTTSL